MRRVDPRILVLAACAVLAIAFSLYKAFGAFYTKPSANPSLPSAAFVSPPQSELTDNAYVTAPRLPTSLETAILNDSRILSSQAAQRTLKAVTLTKLGMSQSAAERARSQANGVFGQLARFRLAGGVSYRLVSVNSKDAVVRLSLIFSDPTGVAASRSVDVELVWAAVGRDWSSARLGSMSSVLTA